MRILLLLALFGTMLPAVAAVYRWVDPNGEVHYSDQPGPGTEEVKLREATVYTPAPVGDTTPASTGQGKADETPDYKSMSIAAPANDEAIRSNQGLVDVSLTLQPALMKGHRIRIYLDGQPASGELNTTQITLQNVDRGTHTLQASVIDAQGNEVIRSPSVTFHLLRVSAPRKAPRAG